MTPSSSTVSSEPLIQALEACVLPPKSFGHRQHVQAAWIYLRGLPPSEALTRCREAIRRFATSAGAPKKYHETITWAYVLLTHERMIRPEAPTDWEGFAQRFPELFDWAPGLLDEYYREDTLRSDVARTSFVLPDAGPTFSSLPYFQPATP